MCNSNSLVTLYSADSLPLFQNKVFSSKSLAKSQQTASIELCQCQGCGFVFNATFDASLMDYDEEYQNEQNYSQAFKSHLQEVCDYLESENFKDKNIVEIGCGKGYFVELLQNRGFSNVYGFDPAYEGSHPNIIKDYFGSEYKSLNADLVIMRHVLEHIEKPLEFLHMIQSACGNSTKILIEVPDFDWIVSNKAFWDIYFEHCNYFDSQYLESFFKTATLKKLFGGQYLLALADINSLKSPSTTYRYPVNMFNESIEYIRNFLHTHNSTILWGASSKGVTLLNLLDKNKECIDYCIDINPKKQNFFIATTGHKIFSPDILESRDKKEIISVIVTNQNYFDEIIKNYTEDTSLKFYTIEGLLK